MNKIIELLIEYDGGDYVKNGLSISEKIKFEDYDSLTYYKDMTYEIISKGYGFIKWLVDNDKIKKDYKEGLPAITKNGFLLEGDTVLLMLLAISDTPIQDLCAWLK